MKRYLLSLILFASFTSFASINYAYNEEVSIETTKVKNDETLSSTVIAKDLLTCEVAFEEYIKEIKSRNRIVTKITNCKEGAMMVCNYGGKYNLSCESHKRVRFVSGNVIFIK